MELVVFIIVYALAPSVTIPAYNSTFLYGSSLFSRMNTVGDELTRSNVIGIASLLRVYLTFSSPSCIASSLCPSSVMYCTVKLSSLIDASAVKINAVPDSICAEIVLCTIKSRGC